MATKKTDTPEPAEKMLPSGAPDQVTEVDVSHPAIDNDPREGTNPRIHLNDPALSAEEAVAKNLKDQAKK